MKSLVQTRKHKTDPQINKNNQSTKEWLHLCPNGRAVLCDIAFRSKENAGDCHSRMVTLSATYCTGTTRWRRLRREPGIAEGINVANGLPTFSLTFKLTFIIPRSIFGWFAHIRMRGDFHSTASKPFQDIQVTPQIQKKMNKGPSKLDN